jgi:hypothetical protein
MGNLQAEYPIGILPIFFILFSFSYHSAIIPAFSQCQQRLGEAFCFGRLGFGAIDPFAEIGFVAII